MDRLVIDRKKCTGCKSCELACSFHHEKKYHPRRASLRIHSMEKEGDISISLFKDLTKLERQNRFPCDMCVDESEPQCVAFCVPEAITVA